MAKSARLDVSKIGNEKISNSLAKFSNTKDGFIDLLTKKLSIIYRYRSYIQEATDGAGDQFLTSIMDIAATFYEYIKKLFKALGKMFTHVWKTVAPIVRRAKDAISKYIGKLFKKENKSIIDNLYTKYIQEQYDVNPNASYDDELTDEERLARLRQPEWATNQPSNFPPPPEPELTDPVGDETTIAGVNVANPTNRYNKTYGNAEPEPVEPGPEIKEPETLKEPEKVKSKVPREKVVAAKEKKNFKEKLKEKAEKDVKRGAKEVEPDIEYDFESSMNTLKTAAKIFIISLALFIFSVLIYNAINKKESNKSELKIDNVESKPAMSPNFIGEAKWQLDIIYGMLDIMFYPITKVTNTINNIIASIESKSPSEYTLSESIFIIVFGIAFLLFISGITYFKYQEWFGGRK